MTTSRGAFLGLFVLALAVLGAYFPGLSGAFIFDDFPNIVTNPRVHVAEWSFDALYQAAFSFDSGPTGRPVAYISFALTHYFHGLDPWWFKAWNLGLHLFNIGLVFCLTRKILSFLEWKDRPQQIRFALIVAALWALNPIHLTTVLMSVQRMAALSAFFLMLALCVYLHVRQNLWQSESYKRIACWILLLAFWMASVLSKETGLLLPLFIGLLEFTRSDSHRFRISLALALIIISGALFFAGFEMLEAGFRAREFDMRERMLTELRVLWSYAFQIFLPAPEWFAIHHDDIAISHGWLEPPTTILALAGWMAVIYGIFHIWQANRLIGFGVLWFLLGHGMESTFLSLEIAHEHRNYLPSLGLLIGGVAAADMLVDRRATKLYIFNILVGSLLLLSFAVTAYRAYIYSDELLRTQFEAKYHQESSRAQYDAGVQLVKRYSDENGIPENMAELAQGYYRRSIELSKSSKAGLIGLLHLNCLRKNKDGQDAIVQQLIDRFSYQSFAPGDSRHAQDLFSFLMNGQLCLEVHQGRALLRAGLRNPEITSADKGKFYYWLIAYEAQKGGGVAAALKISDEAQLYAPNIPGLTVQRAYLQMQDTQTH